MAFDSTISGTTANSYIPVSAADDYFLFHLDGAAYWNTLPLATKQAALVQATNRIDMESFSGRPTIDAQRLQFPRSWIVSRNMNPSQSAVENVGGIYFRPNDVIWKEVSDATCEMALHLLRVNAGEFTADENDLETLSSLKVGPLDITIKDNVKADRLPTKVKSLLSAIGPQAWLGQQPLSYDR